MGRVAELGSFIPSMDLTDLTISPMIPFGIAVGTSVIKTHTGWSWIVSIAAGIIPGAILGFVAGVLLFWVVSGICWTFWKLLRRHTSKPPD